MNPAISIDFGSAYTKVAIRRHLNQPSQLVIEDSLVQDPQRFCIPTLAAADERAGKTRWAFGPDAMQIVQGDGIRVYRNWKSHLFTAPGRLQGKLPTTAQRSEIRVASRRTSETAWASSPVEHTALEIKAVTLRYFSWLRKFLEGPCSSLGITDLSLVPVRLCVPAFGMSEREEGNYSSAEELLLHVLSEAGWNPADERPIVTEPQSNAVGIYTQGANATWTPSGPRGRKYIHFQQMFGFGGYLPALRTRSLLHGEQNHCVLVVDVGAFTTDLAFLDFDLDQEEKPPCIQYESQALGVQRLDLSVLEALPTAKATKVKRLDTRRWEELKRSLYVDQAPYRLEGATVGAGTEGSAIQKLVHDFAEQITEFINDFLRQNQITQLQEVILTGGGNMIPEICSLLMEGLLKRGLDTRLVHSPIGDVNGNSARFFHRAIDARFVRGASGIGGASVYFERRYW